MKQITQIFLEGKSPTLTLIWGGGNFTPSPQIGFPLITLSNPGILQHSVTFRDVRVKFGIPNLSHSLQMLGKTQTRLFPISGFLVNPW